MLFRPATIADAHRIAALHTESWQETYRGDFSDDYLDQKAPAERLEVWTKRLTNPKPEQWVLVVEEGQEIIAFACVFLNADPVYGALLDNLHVAKTHRGKKLGRQLTERAAAWIREQGGDRFFLWVLQSNSLAVGVYDHLGGERVESAMFPTPEGGTSPVYRYSWRDLEKFVS